MIERLHDGVNKPMTEIESLIAKATTLDADVTQRHEAFGEIVKRFQDMAYVSCLCDAGGLSACGGRRARSLYRSVSEPVQTSGGRGVFQLVQADCGSAMPPHYKKEDPPH